MYKNRVALCFLQIFQKFEAENFLHSIMEAPEKYCIFSLCGRALSFFQEINWAVTLSFYTRINMYKMQFEPKSKLLTRLSLIDFPILINKTSHFQ